MSLTDDFVKDNLKDDYGYTSVENMRQTIAKDLRDSQVYDAMMETILKNCPVSEVPQKLVDNEITIVIKQLKFSALQYSMEPFYPAELLLRCGERGGLPHQV